jgi:uncharacterized Zn finger protein
MQFPAVSEDFIRQNATQQSWSRAESYASGGRVTDLCQRGGLLQAFVDGSDLYRVTIEFDQTSVNSATCSCPYDYSGWCKHIIATLMVASEDPDQIERRASLPELLDRLNPVQTQQLVKQLVVQYPELMDAIDRHVTLLNPPGAKATGKSKGKSKDKRGKPTIDTAPVKRQIKQILKDGLRDLEYGTEDNPIEEPLLDIVGQARRLAQDGDGENAIALLEAITEACVDSWDDLIEYGGESSEVLEALDEAWSESILVAEPDSQQGVDLQLMLEDWQASFGEDFGMALLALAQGWDHPIVQDLLAGDRSVAVIEDEESHAFAASLAMLRLMILDRQGRTEDYLNVARGAGLFEQYLIRLVSTGDITQVVEVATREFYTASECFALAKVLRSENHPEEALTIAQLGLQWHDGAQYPLAIWTAEFAESLKQKSIALEAYQVAFSSRPDLKLYQCLETLSGKAWKALRLTLLEQIRTTNPPTGIEAKINILLYEKQWDDAIVAITPKSAYGYYSYHVVHKVMDAVVQSHADWVISTAIAQAEEIMNAGKADKYYMAIEWLKRVKASYVASDRSDEWRTYRAQLTVTYGKKRKLMELMAVL